MSYHVQMANEKNSSSSNSRIVPGTGTGAEPERPGSSATLKIAHMAATITGIPKARRNRSNPSPCLHPHIPMEIIPTSSRRKRTAKLIG